MNYTKVIFGALVLVAVAGAYYFPQVPSFFGSPSGTTFNTAKFAGVVISAGSTGANGTSTSILNTDASTRYVAGYKVGCSSVGTSYRANDNAGIANWTISIGTTSSASPNSIVTFSNVANGAPIATTSVNVEIASSTVGAGQAASASSSASSVWHAGEYMTFFLNATNTATCTVGVDYIGS